MNDFKVFRNLLGYLRGILWRKKDKPNYLHDFNKRMNPNNLKIIHRQEEYFFIGYYECQSTKKYQIF
jgi:hypothetical protein